MRAERPAAELDAFDFELPERSIAQLPAEPRDAARMLVLPRVSGACEHSRVRDLPERLRAGDLLVVNTTRVLAARLRGHKTTGGAAEALLLGPASEGAKRDRHRALLRTGGRLRVGLKLRFERAGIAQSTQSAEQASLDAEVVALGSPDERGAVVLAFARGASPYALGEPPLPPYIRRNALAPADQRALDAERYQTLFARQPGAVAAPTAGLHFTPQLLAAIEARGVERAELVLHVGLGTFQPLSAEQLARGELHAERYELPAATASAIARTRERGGRVVAVGTTTTRVLEHCALADGRVEPGEGETRLFLRPGDPFRVIDALLTNFHLPRSSLLMLVAAFAGRERVLDAYAQALRADYRFYSYGDAMWIA